MLRRYANHMMRITVLASGSKGNSTIVASSRTRVLVDAGLSCRELLKRMLLAGEDPDALDAILITHEHLDHINGLAVLARKLGVPVYFTEAAHRAWARMMSPRTTMTYAQWLDLRRAEMGPKDAEQTAILDQEEQDAADATAPTDPARLPAVEYFRAGSNFCIGDIAVTPFTVPHDAADPVGFVFETEGIRMAIATDLGYMPPNVRAALRRCDVLMIESNHDLEMLRDGPYPWQVKQRVLSRVGHLSNDAAAEFLAGEYDGGASYVILAHLSESNNLPELARVAAEQALQGRMNLLGNRLVLAQQNAPMQPICL